jgi:hypothetical protein
MRFPPFLGPEAVIWLELEQIQPSPGEVLSNTELAVVAEKASPFLAGKYSAFYIDT